MKNPHVFPQFFPVSPVGKAHGFPGAEALFKAVPLEAVRLPLWVERPHLLQDALRRRCVNCQAMGRMFFFPTAKLCHGVFGPD